MGIRNSKMNDIIHQSFIKVNRKNLRLVRNQSEIIHNLFPVRVLGKIKKDEVDSKFVYIPLKLTEDSTEKITEITNKVQVG